MSIYQVDLGQPYNNTHTNTGAVGSPWGAPAGLMRAIAAAAAGDTIRVLNHATPANNTDMSMLVTLAVASTVSISVGDLIHDNVPETPAQIRVAVVATGYVIGETLWPSTAFDSGDDVYIDTTVVTTATADQALCPILFDDDFAASGGAAGAITIEGFASDGSTPEAAYLNCGSGMADVGVEIGDVAGWTIRRMEIDAPGLYGVSKATNVYQTGWRLEGVVVNNAGDRGFTNMAYLQYGTMRRCAAIDATNFGMANSPYAGRVEWCRFTGAQNLDGVGYPSLCTTFDGCLIANNGRDGIHSFNTGVTVTRCTIDGNTGDGVEITNTDTPNIRILNNRITNNGGYGVNAPDMPMGSLSDVNVYYGNTSGPMTGWTGGDDDHGPAGSGLAHEDVTADGMIDAANGDYRLKASDPGWRMPVALDDDNTTYVSAGAMAPMGRRPECRAGRMIG